MPFTILPGTVKFMKHIERLKVGQSFTWPETTDVINQILQRTKKPNRVYSIRTINEIKYIFRLK